MSPETQVRRVRRRLSNSGGARGRALLPGVLILAMLAVAAGAAAGPLPVPPLSVPFCRVASPPTVLDCPGSVQAGDTTVPFDLQVRTNVSGPRTDSLSVGTVWTAYNSVWYGIRAGANEAIVLGDDGTYGLSFLAQVNSRWVWQYVGSLGLGLWLYNSDCYDGKPCTVNSIPIPLDYHWCGDPQDCAGCPWASAVHIVYVPVRGLYLQVCVDPLFVQRIHPAPGVGIGSPSSALSPPPLFEDPVGSGNGLVGYSAFPYKVGPAEPGCYGHVSGDGFTGTQEVCVQWSL